MLIKEIIENNKGKIRSGSNFDIRENNFFIFYFKFNTFLNELIEITKKSKKTRKKNYTILAKE